jgi:wyosine [tRNA(Phe)-imidazoG37] synthetase (radical SAM superfamily)
MIGLLIRQVKTLTDIPIAILTNGSLLYRPEVRRDLAAADAVLPTLDAGTPELIAARDELTRP